MGKALALLALALSLWEWGSCWGLGSDPEDLEKSPRSDPGPWEVLHRHRRSWVWNQFFVLEEYTGNEPLYVGKVSDTPPLTGSEGHARTYRARATPDDGYSPPIGVALAGASPPRPRCRAIGRFGCEAA